MKIAISGAHSTGKTTFLKTLTEILQLKGINYVMLGDLAVKCPLPILKNHTVESTLWIASKGMFDEIEAEHKNKLVIVDRPILDCWAYFQVACKDKYSTDHPKLMALEAMIQNWSKTYDLTYQTIIDETIPIENAKGRILDTQYRTDVGNEMKMACDKFGITPIYLEYSKTQYHLEELVAKILKNLS